MGLRLCVGVLLGNRAAFQAEWRNTFVPLPFLRARTLALGCDATSLELTASLDGTPVGSGH